MATGPLPETMTPGHLTEVLRRASPPGAGQVNEVAVESSRTTIVSTITRLRLGYAGDAGGPTHLFLKRARTDLPSEFAQSARREVDFYTSVTSVMPPGIVPRCFEAVCDSAPGHVLLEDLSDSHVVVGEWPLPPTLAECERIIDAYARLHGFWWDDARLGVTVGAFLDAAFFDRWLDQLAKRWAGFVDRLGDRLSLERREIYEQLMRAAPRLLARYQSHRHLSLVHGDAHVWNLMYPRDPTRDSVRLVDWDGWRIDTATDDLAYMMAVHWYPERRRRFERQLLQRYHADLITNGVSDYDFDTLWDDYRQSVLWQLTTPVAQTGRRLGPWIWWSHLERIALAVEDLGCRELLE